MVSSTISPLQRITGDANELPLACEYIWRRQATLVGCSQDVTFDPDSIQSWHFPEASAALVEIA